VSIENSILSQESFLRGGMTLALFVLFSLIELLRPFKSIKPRDWQRWGTNLVFVFLGVVTVRFLLPLTAFSLALKIDSSSGVFALFEGPILLKIILGVLVLDMTVYFQHRMFHRLPIFWRLHKMHHADPEFDVTTALRFHPIEIMVSMAIKMSVVWVFGMPAASVLIFEVILNAGSLFNHSNFALPAKAERVLRFLVITPSLHRVHHSPLREDHDSNYGFSISLWDLIFGTFRPKAKLEGSIGLSDLAPKDSVNLLFLLGLPFRSKFAKK
jgi:sterol desaturase/sphingolipid hydroxylase (fatty acid hydroxylase superfamily)